MIDLLSPSSLLRHMHDSLKIHEANGLRLHPEACSAMMRNLKTIEELALNIEQELAIATGLLGDRGPVSAAQQNVQFDRDKEKVLVLPFRPRIVSTKPDGGDAA